jgi:hypothetical protein
MRFKTLARAAWDALICGNFSDAPICHFCPLLFCVRRRPHVSKPWSRPDQIRSGHAVRREPVISCGLHPHAELSLMQSAELYSHPFRVFDLEAGLD